MDNLAPEKRKKIMSSIKGKDTKPELLLWEELDHRMLRRYPQVKGKPDFGSISRRVAVFMDGCFWHGCPRCYKPPSTRPEYWQRKLMGNKMHDTLVTSALESEGYVVMRFWEHAVVQDPAGCARNIMEVLGSRKR